MTEIIKKLTDKQESFVQNYLIDLNAKQAAIRSGYSEKTAKEIGYQLMQQPEVIDAIKEAKKKRNFRLNLKQDMVISELVKVGFSSVADYVKEFKDGKIILRDFDEIPPECLSAIHHISSDKNGNVSIKMQNKMQALILLYNHLKLNEPKKKIPNYKPKNVFVINDQVIEFD